MCFFCSYDLDMMTLTRKLDLTILKMCLHTKNELSRSRLSKVRALQTDRERERHRCNWMHYHATFAGGKNYQRTQPANEDSCISKQFWVCHHCYHHHSKALCLYWNYEDMCHLFHDSQQLVDLYDLLQCHHGLHKTPLLATPTVITNCSVSLQT